MQYLSVKWSEKLASSSTVDDPESALAKFMPERMYHSKHYGGLN